MTARQIEFTLARGGSGTIVQTDGQHVVLQCDVAAAPGTPLKLRARHLPVVEAASPEPAHSNAMAKFVQYEVKVRGSRRISEQPLRYQIEGRFINLSTAARERLLSAMADQR